MQVYNFYGFGANRDYLVQAELWFGFEKEVHPTYDVKTRWLSHSPVFEKVLHLWPSLMRGCDIALEHSSAEQRPTVEGMLVELCRFETILSTMYMIVMYSPYNLWVKSLQQANAHVLHLQQIGTSALSMLHERFLSPRAFTGRPFEDLNKFLSFKESMSNGMSLVGDAGAVLLRCEARNGSVGEWVALAKPSRASGRAKPVPSQMCTDDALAVAASVRAQAKVAAQALFDKAQRRLPECAFVEATRFVP